MNQLFRGKDMNAYRLNCRKVRVDTLLASRMLCISNIHIAHHILEQYTTISFPCQQLFIRIFAT